MKPILQVMSARDQNAPRQNPLPHSILTRKLPASRAGAPVVFAVLLFTTLFVTTPLGAQSFTSPYSFPGGTQGSNPGNLIVGPTGSVFGVTQQGGNLACDAPFGCGAVYVLSTNGTETVLHRFLGSSQNDGAGPSGIVLNASTRTLYGIASGGGTVSESCVNGCGTVFKIDPSGKETTLHTFTDSPDGNLPLGTPILDAAGNLYGVTFYGGASSGQTGSGTVFEISSTGVYSMLYEFSATANGTNPNGSLVRDSAGNLYGTTTYGGTGACNNGFLPGCGVVFKLDPAGNETVLHDFTGGQDSQYPSSLNMDSDGNLYGLAAYNGQGEIFKIDTAGNFKILDFGVTVGTIQSLILGPAGSFYATTSGGDSNCNGGCGTVLELFPNGTGYYNVILLKTFTGTDGAYPVAITSKRGILYGTTYEGGASNFGTVYKLVP